MQLQASELILTNGEAFQYYGRQYPDMVPIGNRGGSAWWEDLWSIMLGKMCGLARPSGGSSFVMRSAITKGLGCFA